LTLESIQPLNRGMKILEPHSLRTLRSCPGV